MTEYHQANITSGWFECRIQLTAEKWLCSLSVSQAALCYWVNCFLKNQYHSYAKTHSTKDNGLNFRKFPVTNATAFCEISGKEPCEVRQRIFSQNSYRELLLYLIFLPEIPEVLVEWFAFRKVDISFSMRVLVPILSYENEISFTYKSNPQARSA